MFGLMTLASEFYGLPKVPSANLDITQQHTTSRLPSLTPRSHHSEGMSSPSPSCAKPPLISMSNLAGNAVVKESSPGKVTKIAIPGARGRCRVNAIRLC